MSRYSPTQGAKVFVRKVSWLSWRAEIRFYDNSLWTTRYAFTEKGAYKLAQAFLDHEAWRDGVHLS